MTHTTESLIERLRTTPPNVLKEREAAHLITELAADRDALEKMVRQYVQNFNEVEDERNTLRAQLDALQSGDELPELQPFFDACGKGTAYYGHMIKDAMQSYARQAQAMTRAKMLAELGAVEAGVKQVTGRLYSDIAIKANAARNTRPLPAQDVNAELVEALSASCHTEHLLLRGEVCRCSQCEFVRLRDTALANTKAEQQKELK